MPMVKQTRFTIFLFSVVVAWAACVWLPSVLFAAASSSGSLPQLLAAAKRERELGLVAGGGVWGEAQGIRGLAEGFNKKYGLNVEIKWAPGPSYPALANRVIEELKAGLKATTDLYVGTESHVPGLVRAGAVDPFPWELFPHITKEMLDLDGRVLLRDTRFPGITYNSKLVSNDEVPRRLEDLLDPKWSGKIASTPYAGSFDRLADTRVLGYEKTKAFLIRFSKAVAGLIRCGEDERIATGEFWLLALNCGNHEPALGKKNGLPVEGAVIEDIPLMMIHAYVVVPKNSAHPNLATLFAAFVVSAEGQQILWENQRVASHLVGGTTIERQYQAAKDRRARIVDFPASYTAGREKRLGEMRTEFQKILTQK